MQPITWTAIGSRENHLRGLLTPKYELTAEEWVVGPPKSTLAEIQLRSPAPEGWDWRRLSTEEDAVEKFSDEYWRLRSYASLREIGHVYHPFMLDFVEAIRAPSLTEDWKTILETAGFERTTRPDYEDYELIIAKPGTKTGKVAIGVYVKDGKHMSVRYSAYGSRYSYLVLMTGTHTYTYDDRAIPHYPPNANVLGMAAKFLVDVLVPDFRVNPIQVLKERY